MLAHPALRAVASQQDRTPAQVALAWLLRQDGLVVIPRARSLAHVRENHTALEVRLTDADLAALDRAFPPPSGPQPLDTL
jgi:aryl-alcohol dehydrogenase-like predicted oxidoreductase